MEETLGHPISIRQMQGGDLPFCRHFVNEAGWNQLDNDWLRAMRLEPGGCFVATIDDLRKTSVAAKKCGSSSMIHKKLIDFSCGCYNFR